VELREIAVRSVRPEEHEAVGDLCVAAYDAIGLASEHYVQTLRDTAARVAGADVLVAVARDDGNRSPAGTRWPLGTVTLITDFGPYGEIARAGEAEFRLLATAPQAQGRGVGEALVRACAERSAALGRRLLVCSSRPDMEAAHRLYRRMGFTRTPDRDWSPRPDVPLVTFALALDPA
jgi:ribosomal protein S18 acetylase RimI-like enzyme